MVLCMCTGVSSIAFAAEDTPGETITSEVQVGSDGWGVLEVPATTMDNTYETRGGAETWKATTLTKVGTFTMTGNNLTPVKTIGISRDYLLIRVDSFSASKPVKLTVQIREAYTGKVLSKKTSSATSSGKNLMTTCGVKKGDKVQIYFRVTDANGVYNDNLACKITYSYRLVNSPM